MNDYFTVLSTPELQLQYFLKEVVGVDSRITQQGRALSIDLPGAPNEHFVLLMADGFTQHVWHLVSTDGTRAVLTGYLSVINMLIGLGVKLEDDLPNGSIFHTRWAKAKRIYDAAPEFADVVGAGADVWKLFAEARGENAPSDRTLRIIEQLVREDQ